MVTNVFILLVLAPAGDSIHTVFLIKIIITFQARVGWGCWTCVQALRKLSRKSI